LVCTLDNRFDDLLKEDSEIYGQYYKATTTALLPSIQALPGRLDQRYDIVHLICDVTESGTIRDTNGHEVTGTELIQFCCDQNVKLLWSASDNPPERYIKGFGARGKRLNLAELRRRMIEKSLNPFRISLGNRRVYTTFAIELKTLR